MLGRGRFEVVPVMEWMGVRGESAVMTLCVATGESERGDVVRARAFVPVLLCGHDSLKVWDTRHLRLNQRTASADRVTERYRPKSVCRPNLCREMCVRVQINNQSSTE